MTTPTEPRPGGGVVILGGLALWGWFVATFIPPLFWLMVIVLVFSMLNTLLGGGSTARPERDYNCGAGGVDTGY